MQHWGNLLPFSGSTFMMIVGIIEIGAGILVLIRPKQGALVVCAWLVLIAFSLLAGGKSFDIAVRDVVMATYVTRKSGESRDVSSYVIALLTAAKKPIQRYSAIHGCKDNLCTPAAATTDLTD